MKKTLAHLFIIVTATIFVGCAIKSLNSTMFGSTQLAVDSATDATHTFNIYYDEQATNPAANITTLNSERDTLYKLDENLAKSAQEEEAIRQTYTTNSSVSNLLEAAAITVEGQSTNIVNLVNTIVKSNQ